MDAPSRTFLAVTFASSWLVAAVLACATDFMTPAVHVAGGFLFMCGPAVGALVAWRAHGLPSASFGLSKPKLGWLVRAWAWGVAIVACAVALSLLLPGVVVVSPGAALLAQLKPDEAAKLTASMPEPSLSVALVLQASVLGPLLNLPFMLSEELGWRGLWWSRTQALPFWSRAGLVGGVWGVWHAPLIAMGHNYPGSPVLGALLMVVFCVLLTPPMHFLRERGESVWSACMFHGSINALNTLSLLCLSGASPLLGGVPGLAGCSALLVSCVVVWSLRRERRGAPHGRVHSR